MVNIRRVNHPSFSFFPVAVVMQSQMNATILHKPLRVVSCFCALGKTQIESKVATSFFCGFKCIVLEKRKLGGGWTTHFKNIRKSNWIISLGRGENKKYLKPPPRKAFIQFQYQSIAYVGTPRPVSNLVRSPPPSTPQEKIGQGHFALCSECVEMSLVHPGTTDLKGLLNQI